MTNGHGGVRIGAGRKPRALRYRGAVALAEVEIARNLVSLVKVLIERALKHNDVKAATYLIDRFLGRIPTFEGSPPAFDSTNPLETRQRLEAVATRETVYEQQERQQRQWAAEEAAQEAERPEAELATMDA